MSTIEAFVLGLIQGLTEFLPVSSSGHLELTKAIFGNEALPAESLTFTVVLHFATALSTIIIFRSELLEIIKGLFQFKYNESMKFSLKIIISMVPAVIIGLLFEEQLAAFFSEQILLVGCMLVVTAVLLLFADRAKNTTKEVNYWSAFIIGISQAIAMLPGISRSGATISTSVLLGIDRTKAAKFSFLMVVPLILGKVAKDLIGGEIDYHNDQLTYLVVGFISAFVAGLFACTWMIALVKRSKLSYFAIYCTVVGITAIMYAIFIQ
ncbi:undecaprenyl-diphosphate phosphatase [Flavobacteriaceae bacterium F08102]|nr:undecaprenyl-diphosphate phosphatase [Flavobacteriaceae bacterium F08102]